MTIHCLTSLVWGRRVMTSYCYVTVCSVMTSHTSTRTIVSQKLTYWIILPTAHHFGEYRFKGTVYLDEEDYFLLSKAKIKQNTYNKYCCNSCSLSKPCPECKTNDPNNFVIQGIDQLQCVVCQSIVNLHASDVTLQHSSSPSSNSTEITQVVASIRVKRRRLPESDNGEQCSTQKKSRGSDNDVIWYSPPIDDDCSAQPIECEPVWYSPPIESEHHSDRFAGQDPVWYSPPIEDEEASLITRNVTKNTKVTLLKNKILWFYLETITTSMSPWSIQLLL